MAESSLITVTRNTRRFLLFFAIFVIVVLIINLIANSISSSRPQTGRPASSPTLTQAQFGKLPTTALPQNSLSLDSSSQPIYNTEGQFAAQPATINVYKLNKASTDARSQTIYKAIAEKFGFSDAFRQEANALIWESGDKRLTFDLKQSQWTYRGSRKIAQGNFGRFNSDASSYRTLADSLLATLNLKRNYVDINKLEVEYLISRGNVFVTAGSYTQAEFVKIKINPTINKLPLFSLNSLSAAIEIIASTPEPAQLNLESIYSLTFPEINLQDNPAQYILEQPNTAWTNLESLASQVSKLELLYPSGTDKYQYGLVPGQKLISYTTIASNLETGYVTEFNSAGEGYLVPAYRYTGRARLSNSPDQDNAQFSMLVYAFKNPV